MKENQWRASGLIEEQNRIESLLFPSYQLWQSGYCGSLLSCCLRAQEFESPRLCFFSSYSFVG